MVSAREVTLPGAYICFCVNCQAHAQYYVVIFVPIIVCIYLASINPEHEEHTGARTVTSGLNCETNLIRYINT